MGSVRAGPKASTAPALAPVRAINRRSAACSVTSRGTPTSGSRNRSAPAPPVGLSSGQPQHPSGQTACVLAILDDEAAVDEDLLDSRRYRRVAVASPGRRQSSDRRRRVGPRVLRMDARSLIPAVAPAAQSSCRRPGPARAPAARAHLAQRARKVRTARVRHALGQGTVGATTSVKPIITRDGRAGESHARRAGTESSRPALLVHDELDRGLQRTLPLASRRSR